MTATQATLSVLGIPGSLRSGSFNRRLLELAKAEAPSTVALSIYEDLGAIPPFNEDLEGEAHIPPAPVGKLRDAIARADAVLVATPEYNQSMPGVLKNAIDWLSRPAPESAFAGKPVALGGITAGEWGTRLSQAALRQTLFATEARLVPLHLYVRRAATVLPEGGPPSEELRLQIADFMAELERTIRSQF